MTPSSGSSTSPSGSTLPSTAASLREPLLTFGAVIALAAALYWGGLVSGALHRWVPLLIALAFVYAPSVAVRLSGRPFSFDENGFTWRPWRSSLGLLAVVVAITFPSFIGAFFWFYGEVCRPHHLLSFARSWFPVCSRFRPEAPHGPALDGDFLVTALNQLVVVALPEELFFRSYLDARLRERWPAAHRLFGAPVGRALLVQAALFALGHVLVDLNPQRFAVFFPALLFGWMRARTGSVWPGALFHALCNVLSDVLHSRYFG